MQCIETEGNKYTISRSFLEEANIVVAHGIVIGRFSYEPYIPFCRISEIDFDESFKCTFKLKSS